MTGGNWLKANLAFRSKTTDVTLNLGNSKKIRRTPSALTGQSCNWLYKSPYRERAARVLAARAQVNGHEETPRFVPVSVVAATGVTEERAVSATIEVVLAGGARIAVAPGFDGETLRRVVAALEARSC